MNAPRPAACPRPDDRLVPRAPSPGHDRTAPVELVAGVWHVRSAAVARELLRSRGTLQAGFQADAVRTGVTGMRYPVLYLDGDEHRAARTSIARYFAPTTVTRRYRDLMEQRADELVAEIEAAGEADLADVALRYSVDIAAQVVGLTDSDREGMTRRLEVFFSGSLGVLSPTSGSGEKPEAAGRLARLTAGLTALRSLLPMGRFYLSDVRPAVRARRARRRDDVISHLIDQGRSATEILSECLTYAAAGMVTTREFLSLAAWHLLRDDALRERYLGGGDDERMAILLEILRLEPIIGTLYRRLAAPLEVGSGEQTVVLPAGALVAVPVHEVDLDERVVGAGPAGEGPAQLCPGRELPPGYKPEMLGFGDGAHRCPGNALALQESDVFLQRLLRLPLVIERDPEIGWDAVVEGFELRDVRLRVSAVAPEPARR